MTSKEADEEEEANEKASADDDDDDDDEEHYEGPWWKFPPMRNALVSGLFLAVGFATDQFDLVPHEVSIGLFIVAAIAGASHWGREALEALPKLRVNIDVLMAVATVGAAALGLWEEAAFLAFLYGAAEALEELTYDRTRSAIRSLLDLAPKEAHVLRDGREVTIAAEELVPGDVFRVRPGESLPTDGRIRTGETSLNEAAITGESVPVEKGPDAEVFAGSLNQTGSIDVIVTRRFEDNTLSRIIHLVEEAQEQKTKAQRFIDRFGSRYSPAVLTGVVALLAVPPLLGADFREWAIRAVTLAVAAAPCALVMSTPVAVAAAIGTAGKRGVLIKGGLHLETLGLLRALALDKTGTLTRNRPQVTDIVPLGPVSSDQVLALAASVETFSEHPLAKAIVEQATVRGLEVAPARRFQALTGAGASAAVGEESIFVGSLDLFRSHGADLNGVDAQAEEHRQQGKTTVLVGPAGKPLGLIAIRDEIRPEAQEAIRGLHGAGIKRVVMLTGDNERTARAIAQQVGIDDVRANLKPEDKSKAIGEIRASAGSLGMVGDGVNDAPALAAADVGIAMGTAGSDAAIEAADIALMGDDLRGLVYAVRLGRKAQFVSRQNIVFSLLLLAVLIPLAVLGIVSVAVAVIAHEVSELIAVANGLRARVSER
jgi:Cd2+/Zn2+-exporting ATPase